MRFFAKMQKKSKELDENSIVAVGTLTISWRSLNVYPKDNTTLTLHRFQLVYSYKPIFKNSKIFFGVFRTSKFKMAVHILQFY